jgi:pilus assembly protein TadC
MSNLEDSFNRSGFSKFLNNPAGRIFRLVAGIGFIIVGYIFRDHVLGIVSIVWGALPLTAGAFDICYFSALLGGPISGKKIREKQRNP